MAYRLGDYVVYGELRNLRRYSTFGLVALRGERPGMEYVFHIELTGDCDADLHGKHFRFRPAEHGDQNAVFLTEEYRGFQDRQVGTTGTMTAQGWVRVLPCDVEEYISRAELGEPPPTTWRRRLYLEWYGQNGRVLLEVPGACVEECVREPEGEDDEGDWAPIPNLAPMPEEGGTDSRGLGITMFSIEGGKTHTRHWSAPRVEDPCDDDALAHDALQDELDREAADIDRAIFGENSHYSENLEEMELMDWCIEEGVPESFVSFLGNFKELPRPEDLDDRSVELCLKGLLARLAAIGVALDVCEHFTPRESYRLLLDEILTNEGAYRELVGTGWVQHFSTSDFCAKCEAEVEDMIRREKTKDSPDQSC